MGFWCKKSNTESKRNGGMARDTFDRKAFRDHVCDARRVDRCIKSKTWLNPSRLDWILIILIFHKIIKVGAESRILLTEI